MKKHIDDFRSMLRGAPPLLLSMLFLSVVGMNLLANKSVNTGLDWLALDCGFIFSGFTFLAMDVLTHCCGPRAATAAAVTALAANLLMSLLFFLGSLIPGAWGESFVEEGGELINAALDNTFGGTWYIIVGSAIAFVSSAALNNFMNYGIGVLVKKKGGFGVFALRSYVSTGVAQFADNIIFALLVSRVFFGWTMLQCVTCALTGALFELLLEVIFSPIGYRIAKRITDADGAGKTVAEAK